MFSLRCIVFVVGAVCVLGIPREVMYPKGLEHGDNKLPVGDDGSSNEIPLEIPIAFYDDYYSSIFVNTNGLLSFGTNIDLYRADLVLPLGHPVIAPFLADIDIRLSGDVYYRETRDPSLLEMAAREIHPNFPRRRNFQPLSLFIVTWDHVGYFNKQYDQTNTFQVVIASDGADSFVMFLYPEVSWIRSQGKSSPSVQDVPAQAGFDSGDRRRYYTLPGSGNEYINEISRSSNAGVPGVWMFRVGNTYGGNIETSGDHTDTGVVDDEVPASCVAGGDRLCSINGQCRDFQSGFCCECQKPFVGNGINCVQPEIQMRVNGHVTGTLNGITLDEANLHAFMMFKDGRVYIAISRVTPKLGFSMQSLFSFAGGLGWLLALPSVPQSKNGYQITGGDFNRTATIRFLDTGDVVNLEQTHRGQNAEGHMDMHSKISGSIPVIQRGAQLVIPDYKDEFRRTKAGEIKSFSTHTFTVDNKPIHFTVDQTLRYEECPHRPPNGEKVQRLAVSRSFIHFDDNEQQIVRYAQSNKLTTIVDDDPCREASQVCSANADCVPHRDSYKCYCKDGFTGDGQLCEDVDECRRNTHDCHQNARCINAVGSYECRCSPGFSGDGRNCQREVSCTECHARARCLVDKTSGDQICQCEAGYYGDGYSCEPILSEFDCNEVNNCDDNAECAYDYDLGRYECQCNDGFSGDGLSCSDTGEAEVGCQNCDRHASCQYDVYRLTFVCQCKPGFSGDGRTCFRLEDDMIGCDSLRCDVNANCAYDEYRSAYTCRCNPGFSGDGYVCQRSGDCSIYNNCDRNARCQPSPFGTYQCVCNEGYEGDGLRCREASCNVINNCDINADCLYDPNSETYQCQCRQGYTGDGFSCRLTADCRRDPGICDPNARCENRGYDYICVCNPGHRGDGYRCAPMGDATSYLLLAQGMTIMSMPFNPTDDNPGKPVLTIPGQTAIGIDVDCFGRYFYWTDVAGRVISRAQLDGKDQQVLVSDLGSPEGVAVDWITGNMYWTDSKLDRIEVASTDGRKRTTLVNKDLVDPRGIVVDPVHGTMFWTDWNRKKPVIERASMDGSNRRVLITERVGLPNGLTIDFGSHHVCWVDADTHAIECMNYEGSGRRSIFAQTEYPFDIAYTSNVFYWTDWHKKNLQSINKFATSPNEALKVPSGGHGRLYGLAVVKAQCPAGSNACALNNGGCRDFICLPTPNGGRTCVCPEDVDQDECNRITKLL